MTESERREWRNYWATRPGVRGYWAASRRASGAVTSWALRKKGRGAARPLLDYLPVEPANRASETFEDRATALTPISIPTLVQSEDLLAWAKGYEHRFHEFLDGKLVRSSDPEIQWTLHQFGWLLALVAAGVRTEPGQAQQYVGNWIDKMGDATGDPAWRSFSIGERLSNWTHLFQVTDAGSLWPRLVDSVRSQALYLSRHLETDTGAGPNNHLISNGRALYVVGRVFGSDGLARLGRAVLVNEAQRQITSEGFLDEGSSHYQLIVTKDYVEALHAARLTGDADAEEALQPRVTSMLRACDFLRDDDANDWVVPFFGDISPDPPPCFFEQGTRFWQMVAAASGSRDDNGPSVDTSVPWFAGRNGASPRQPRRGWSCNPESGYYRWDSEQYVIWWHARRRGAVRWHSHNDWGSFQLHVQGAPLMIDPGRESYCLVDTTYDGRLTLAQNGVSIDGFEQALFLKRDLFVPEYLESGADVEWHGERQAGTLRIRIDGYERLREPVVHTRTFLLNAEDVTIRDAFDGRGRHTVTAAFHLHPDVTSSASGDNTFQLTTGRGRPVRLVLAAGAAVTVKRGGSTATPGGYCTTQYGTRRATTSIFAEYRGTVPVTLEHRIFLN